MNQNLSSYRIFYTVANTGNISKAAKELYISQPALSKQLGQLEAELGVTLFDRGKHSLKLTRAGEVLLAETNELFRKQETMLERVRAAGNLSENIVQDAHGCAPSLRVGTDAITAQAAARGPAGRTRAAPAPKRAGRGCRSAAASRGGRHRTAASH